MVHSNQIITDINLFPKFLNMADDLIVAEEEIDLAVIDAHEVEDIKAKELKKARVMELIKEEWLDQDPEFMEEISQAFDGILEIQK
jgi:hypothetical protein